MQHPGKSPIYELSIRVLEPLRKYQHPDVCAKNIRVLALEVNKAVI